MKVLVQYDHDSADFRTIELAVGEKDTQEPLEGWRAAFRDTVDGVKYVWVRLDESPRYIWLRVEGTVARRVKFALE
jgi:hypothetical protein